MRQLVSVVTDDGISYLVHDGDETTQIARVINPGLDVAAVVTLGVNLSDALRLTTMSVNGHSSRAVEAREQRALPRAKTDAPLKPHEVKQRQRVHCPVCGPIRDYKRTSLGRHLEDVHKWDKRRAMRAEHAADAVDGAVVETGAPRGAKHVDTPRAKDGRRVVDRQSVIATWPRATPHDVYEFVRAHPDGVSTREIAEALTDTSGRGRQTIGNLLQTLQSQGLITKHHDGMRPHFQNGTPTKTMIVKVAS